MTDVKYRTTDVEVRRAGLAVLISDAETGRSLLVPEDPVANPKATRTGERAAALIYATGRLLGLFRDALNCLAAARFSPDQVVFEVLVLREQSGTCYYCEPDGGGLGLYYPDCLAWCTGRGHPPAVRRFVEQMVDGNTAEAGQCEDTTPDTDGTPTCSAGSPATGSPRPAAG